MTAEATAAMTREEILALDEGECPGCPVCKPRHRSKCRPRLLAAPGAEARRRPAAPPLASFGQPGKHA